MQLVTQRLLDLKVRTTGAAGTAWLLFPLTSTISQLIDARNGCSFHAAEGFKPVGASSQLSGAVDDVSKLVEAQPALLLQAAVEHDSKVGRGNVTTFCDKS